MATATGLGAEGASEMAALWMRKVYLLRRPVI
jgi:hypothetical protein